MVPHTREEAYLLLQSLVGMVIFNPHQGFGATILLDLFFNTPTVEGTNWKDSDADMMIEWDWRIEQGREVLVGSTNSRPDIQKGIKLLDGASIRSIEIWGEVPELRLTLSNQVNLLTGTMADTGPQWSIKLPSGDRMQVVNGEVYTNLDSTYVWTEQDILSMNHATATAERWILRYEKSDHGECGKCVWFVRIDGDYELLDYGVCTNPDSTFDEKVTNLGSGCSSFEDE